MRPQALLRTVALVVLSACSSHAGNTQSAASPSGSPAPLLSCEERHITLDGTSLLVQANIDRTPAQIVVLSAPDEEARAKAYQDARKIFGDPKPDTRTQTRQYKYGLVQTTDLCGRPVMPAASPSP
ncbi:MAG TPA: hypothetical protein VFN49_05015 [Candidatus Aquilonibacter sp.]|nr:hypothetical protein [Candidatus Aquilonibacter sp.]